MSGPAKLVCAVDVDVPRRAVYDQWLRLEEFPLFLGDVKAVRRLDDRHVRWTTVDLGRDLDWTAQILEEVPHRRIEWRGLESAVRWGVVSFDPLSDLRTRVTIRVEYEPQVSGPAVEDALGLLSRRVEDGLTRFKAYVERLHHGGDAPPRVAGRPPPRSGRDLPPPPGGPP